MPYLVTVEKGPAADVPGEFLFSCCLNSKKTRGPRGGKRCAPCGRCQAFLLDDKRRCKKRTCMDSRYCHLHLRHPFRLAAGDTPEEAVIIGVQIKDTKHGKGLFATRDIPKFRKGTATRPVEGLIMRLEYQKITERQLKGRYREGTGHYALQQSELIADAMCVRNAPSYANDPRDGKRSNANRVNAAHVYFVESGELWLVAKKPIKSGQEIFVKYGKSYWKGHDEVATRLKYVRGG